MRTIAWIHAAGSVWLPGGLLVTHPETRLRPKDRLRAQAAGPSDVGRSRAVNEDAIRCVPDPLIAPILGRTDDPAAAARALVPATLEAGAPDNVSVVVIDFERVRP